MGDTLVLLACVALAGLAVGLSSWRLAFLATVVAGFVQDPLRKIVPGEPVFLVTVCVGVMVLALAGAIGRFGMVSLAPISGGDRLTTAVLSLFVALVCVQAVAAWVRFGSIVIAGIGVLAYLSPVPAVWLAYHYAEGVDDVRHFLRLYVSGAAVVTAGIYLSVAGVDTVLLGEVGEGLLLYDPDLGRLALHSGLMRTPEVGAWHAGAGSCLLIVLATTFRGQIPRGLVPVAVLYLIAGGLFTGRRKMLVTVVTFAAIYLLLLYLYRQRSAGRALVVIGAATVSLVVATLFMSPSSEEIRPFVQRGQTGFRDAEERFSGLGLAAISWGYERGGFLGLGAGAGGQGTQHFADAGEVIAGGSAEGGLGKIIVELGVPGLVLALMGVALVARNLNRILGLAAGSDAVLLRLSLGLVAFAAAHVPAFVGAAQIYGDPFVLILLGSSLGFVFAVPRILGLRARAGGVRPRTGRAAGPPRALAQRAWPARVR